MPRQTKLDRRATILAPTQTRDADGGPVTTYAASGVRWCQRVDTSVREVRIASAARGETSAVFTFRYFTGLTTAHRLLCEGRTYTIQPPKEIGRRQFTEVEASEVIGT